MTDYGRVPSEPGSREPSPEGLGPSGFDPSRKLRAMTYEQLVHECCYRGAELVIERQRVDLFKRKLRRALETAWTDFLDANPDDLTSPEDLPDHALVTCEQVVAMVEAALAEMSE